MLIRASSNYQLTHIYIQRHTKNVYEERERDKDQESAIEREPIRVETS